MTYYRYYQGGGGGPGSVNCSYLAPLRTLTISLGYTIEYDLYLYIGTLTNIRQKFYDIHGMPTYTLSVQSTPDTGASITVSPLDTTSQGNGTTNFTRMYDSGTNVSLTAPATFNGRNLSKWTKDGANAGTSPTVVLDMDAAHTMVAVYSLPLAVLADFDDDGDVDQEDFGRFQACYSSTGDPAPAGCEDADLDSDSDVDRNDFGVFCSCMSGANLPPGC